MSKNLVIDCHADTLLKLYLKNVLEFYSNTKEFKLEASEKLLKEGGVDIEVYAIFVPPKFEKYGIEVTMEMIAIAKELDKKGFMLIKSKSDFNKLEDRKKEKSPAMILSMEGAVALERNLKLLDLFYELGVRNIGLTWSRRNLFAQGSSFFSTSNQGEGLSPDGKELVEEVNNFGMVIDISHLNERGFNDIKNYSQYPFIASHSNAWELCQNPRNLKNSQIEDIASADGVIGINFFPKFLTSKNPENATILDVIKHIKHISDIGGINHVGLGSDFDGITMAPKGLENASKIKNIPSLLEKEGFSNQEISKIMGENFKRVFNKVWK